MRRAVVAVIFAITLGVAAWRLQPSAPAPASAPGREFSAARAYTLLASILREGMPHPVGSPANAVVRDRIIDRFRELGYATRIQQAYSCNRRGRCANVENILATRVGETPTVLAVAHYDSVPRGPGASDDGVGFASILEIARAVRGERFQQPVGFLITDGEERGLLGAEAFVRDVTLSESVRAVVNIENRGTSGPGYLFETSSNNYGLAKSAARSLRRPFASSLFYTVYKSMPNDTDVSVFKRAGKVCVNFAAIGDVRYYHTAQDDLAHVDLGTLQHEGENALAMLRELANGGDQERSGDAVFFDVLGFGIVYWPAGWTIWIVIASAIALLPAIRDVKPGQIAVAALAFIAALIVSAVAGVLVAKIAPHRMLHPEPAIAATMALGIAITLLASRLAIRGSSPRGLFAGYAVMWHIIGGALALTFPGTSFMFVFPAAVAAIMAHARERLLLASALWLAAAGLVFFPLTLMVYTAVGALALVAVTLLMAVVATTFAPVVVGAGRPRPELPSLSTTSP